MTFEQSRKLRELAQYLPLLNSLQSVIEGTGVALNEVGEEIKNLDSRISEIYAKIEESNANPVRKGPTPGLAALKKRVEKLENAIGIQN